MKDFFKGLKVVELAGVLAGPATGYFFAELGASVTKIENSKTGGDVTRSWKLSVENKKQKGSAYYYNVNLLKKILFADLSNPSQNKKVQKLIADADLLIVNFKKGDAKKFALTYDELKKINPSLIYASITGFGDNDERLAYDLVLQAESGFMSMNGTEESGPIKMPVAFIDLFAAHQLKEAILIALLKRYKTGKGSKVSVSLFDAALASLANQASNYLNAGYVPGLQGSLHPNIAPYGEIFQTRDKKKVTFAVGSDNQFQRLCAVLKIPALSKIKRFSDNVSRIKYRRALELKLGPQVKKINCSILLQACKREGIPAAQVKNLKEVFHLSEANKLIIERKTSDGKKRAIRSFVSQMNINI